MNAFSVYTCAGQQIVNSLNIQAAVSLPQGGALLQSGNGSLYRVQGTLDSLPESAGAAEPDSFAEFCPLMRAAPASVSSPEGDYQTAGHAMMQTHTANKTLQNIVAVRDGCEKAVTSMCKLLTNS